MQIDELQEVLKKEHEKCNYFKQELYNYKNRITELENILHKKDNEIRLSNQYVENQFEGQEKEIISLQTTINEVSKNYKVASKFIL